MTLKPSDKSRSDIYRDLLPRINSAHYLQMRKPLQVQWPFVDGLKTSSCRVFREVSEADSRNAGRQSHCDPH